jgi:hypothetical protein
MKAPFVSLDLGPYARFEIARITMNGNLDRYVEKDGVVLYKRSYPRKMKIIVNTGAGEMVDPLAEPEFAPKTGVLEKEIEKERRVPCCKVKAEMIGESCNGGRVLRLNAIELEGTFLPQ